MAKNKLKLKNFVIGFDIYIYHGPGTGIEITPFWWRIHGWINRAVSRMAVQLGPINIWLYWR